MDTVYAVLRCGILLRLLTRRLTLQELHVIFIFMFGVTHFSRMAGSTMELTILCGIIFRLGTLFAVWIAVVVVVAIIAVVTPRPPHPRPLYPPRPRLD